MLKINILGTGCTKCHTLAEATVTTADALNLDYQLTKITDIEQIMAYGVMSTPALVIDGQVKLTGRIPSQAEIKDLLSAHLKSSV